MKIRSNVIKYGDDVNTDVIIPSKYLAYTSPYDLARYAMEGIDAAFLEKVKQKQIIVAATNFGCGSSREQAPIALKYAGVKAVVAESFARIFYRNAVNNALPVLALEGISKEIKDGDDLEVDVAKGIIINHTSGKRWSATPMPQLLLDIMSHGGAVAYYRAKRND